MIKKGYLREVLRSPTVRKPSAPQTFLPRHFSRALWGILWEALLSEASIFLDYVSLRMTEL